MERWGVFNFRRLAQCVYRVGAVVAAGFSLESTKAGAQVACVNALEMLIFFAHVARLCAAFCGWGVASSQGADGKLMSLPRDSCSVFVGCFRDDIAFILQCWLGIYREPKYRPVHSMQACGSETLKNQACEWVTT